MDVARAREFVEGFIDYKERTVRVLGMNIDEYVNDQERRTAVELIEIFKTEIAGMKECLANLQ